MVLLPLVLLSAIVAADQCLHCKVPVPNVSQGFYAHPKALPHRSFNLHTAVRRIRAARPPVPILFLDNVAFVSRLRVVSLGFYKPPDLSVGSLTEFSHYLINSFHIDFIKSFKNSFCIMILRNFYTYNFVNKNLKLKIAFIF